MPHTKIKYACDHCDREYSTKSNAQRHEAQCFYLDANQACVTCAHLIAVYDEKFSLEFGEAIPHSYYTIQCDIDQFEDRGAEHKFYRVHCPFWAKRVAHGTYNFGKTLIEEA